MHGRVIGSSVLMVDLIDLGGKDGGGGEDEGGGGGGGRAFCFALGFVLAGVFLFEGFLWTTMVEEWVVVGGGVYGSGIEGREERRTFGWILIVKTG